MDWLLALQVVVLTGVGIVVLLFTYDFVRWAAEIIVAFKEE